MIGLPSQLRLVFIVYIAVKTTLGLKKCMFRRIPRHHRTARVSASDADDEGIDEDLAILVSLKEHMSQEAIEEQLVKNGLKPTGEALTFT